MKGENMEIFTLLETIEDMLENSKEVPFTHKAIIDKEGLLEIILTRILTLFLVVLLFFVLGDFLHPVPYYTYDT